MCTYVCAHQGISAPSKSSRHTGRQNHWTALHLGSTELEFCCRRWALLQGFYVCLCVCVAGSFSSLHLYLRGLEDLYLFLPGRIAELVFSFLSPSLPPRLLPSILPGMRAHPRGWRLKGFRWMDFALLRLLCLQLKAGLKNLCQMLSVLPLLSLILHRISLLLTCFLCLLVMNINALIMRQKRVGLFLWAYVTTCII